MLIVIFFLKFAVFGHFSHCCDQTPDKKQCKKSFIFACNNKRQQECEAAGHVNIREPRERCWCSGTRVSLLCKISLVSGGLHPYCISSQVQHSVEFLLSRLLHTLQGPCVFFPEVLDFCCRFGFCTSSLHSLAP